MRTVSRALVALVALLVAAPVPGAEQKKAEPYPLVEAVEGKFVFAPDSVHPHPETGHQLYLEAVVRSMEKIKPCGKPGPHALPAPMAADNWEQAKLLPLSAVKPSGGWEQLDSAKDSMAKRWAGRLPELWKAAKPGATLSFKFKGTAAYVYDLLGPDCGQVRVTVDDQPPVVRPLIDRYCTYHRLAMLAIGKGLPDAVHTVKIELLADSPDKVKIFKDGKQFDEDPKDNPKYAPNNWYAGAVLVVGELVE